MRPSRELVGRSYGPFPFRVSAWQVASYVEATGDDPDRWAEYAPPSFAGAALFKVAPAFFADPHISSHTRLLIHGEQVFTWNAPWRIGSRHTIEARIGRLRERGGVSFVTFLADVTDDRGSTVVKSRSLFLMSSNEPPAGGEPEREEPAPDARHAVERAGPVTLPDAGSSLPPLPKSASRVDLIRYAAASEDYNPVHWDHDRGVSSGVGGVICHGLLLAAWAMQPAASTVQRNDPLATGRFRFRLPLFPNTRTKVNTRVAGESGGASSMSAEVVSEAGSHVVANLSVRTGPR